jgi:hypothetical protein
MPPASPGSQPPMNEPPGYAAAPVNPAPVYPEGTPPPPGYVPFGMQPPGGGRRTNGLAVASLVLGIVGIILCFLFVPWILAIIFGAIAIKQCNEDPTYTGKGLAIAGLICGLVGMAIIVLIFTTGETNFDFNSIGVGAVR